MPEPIKTTADLLEAAEATPGFGDRWKVAQFADWISDTPQTDPGSKSVALLAEVLSCAPEEVAARAAELTR